MKAKHIPGDNSFHKFKNFILSFYIKKYIVGFIMIYILRTQQEVYKHNVIFTRNEPSRKLDP